MRGWSDRGRLAVANIETLRLLLNQLPGFRTRHRREVRAGAAELPGVAAELAGGRHQHLGWSPAGAHWRRDELVWLPVPAARIEGAGPAGEPPPGLPVRPVYESRHYPVSN